MALFITFENLEAEPQLKSQITVHKTGFYVMGVEFKLKSQ